MILLSRSFRMSFSKFDQIFDPVSVTCELDFDNTILNSHIRFASEKKRKVTSLSTIKFLPLVSGITICNATTA